MSQSSEDTARRMVEAFNARDLDALTRLASPDGVIVAQRSAIEGEYRGHEGVRRWATTYFEAAPDARLIAERVLTADDGRVLILGRQTGTASLGGASFDAPLAAVIEFDGDLMKRVTAHASHAEALAAAGLSAA